MQNSAINVYLFGWDLKIESDVAWSRFPTFLNCLRLKTHHVREKNCHSVNLQNKILLESLNALLLFPVFRLYNHDILYNHGMLYNHDIRGLYVYICGKVKIFFVFRSICLSLKESVALAGKLSVHSSLKSFTLMIRWFLFLSIFRCGNVAAIFVLDEHLQKDFIIFEAAPQEARGVPIKKPLPDYFL